MENASLAPGLLLAAPRLGDPNFHHSVVLLGHHDGEGALGWVLNGRAIVPVWRLLVDAGLVPAGVELPHDGSYGRVVRLGGPVMPGSAWLLFDTRNEPHLPSVQAFDGGFGITCARETIEAVARGEGPRDFRVVLGYAGWGAGQLESEIQVGAWLPAPLDAAMLVERDPEQLWDAAYERYVGAPPAAFTSTTRGSA